MTRHGRDVREAAQIDVHMIHAVATGMDDTLARWLGWPYQLPTQFD